MTDYRQDSPFRIGDRVKIKQGHDYYGGELGRICIPQGEFKNPACLGVITDSGHRVVYLVDEVEYVSEDHEVQS